ncbi:MAG: DUF433 domain-containing protein [Candidatus Hodarchaeota archaeon]
MIASLCARVARAVEDGGLNTGFSFFPLKKCHTFFNENYKLIEKLFMVNSYTIIMEIPDRIIIDPKICMGKPCIKGSRLKVEFILELLASGWTHEQIKKEYDLVEEDILAVLQYAKQMVESEQVFKIPSS